MSDELGYLKERFAYFTECTLATIEHPLKTFPKSELSRIGKIANSMVEVCETFDCVSKNASRLNVARAALRLAKGDRHADRTNRTAD